MFRGNAYPAWQCSQQQLPFTQRKWQQRDLGAGRSVDPLSANPGSAPVGVFQVIPYNLSKWRLLHTGPAEQRCGLRALRVPAAVSPADPLPHSGSFADPITVGAVCVAFAMFVLGGKKSNTESRES